MTALTDWIKPLTDYDIHVICGDNHGKPILNWTWRENDQQVLERRRDLVEIKSFCAELEGGNVFIPRRFMPLLRGRMLGGAKKQSP